MRRWLVALAALLIGGGVSAALLVVANPDRDLVDVYVASHDISSGAVLSSDGFALERVRVASGRSLLFGRGDESALSASRASHDLASGQLIQRTDVMDAGSFADRRLVFVPLKDVPSAAPGSKVDVFVIRGTTERPSVVPFALGIEVRTTVSGGLVLVVASKQAAAFVYAANAMHLAAVIAESGGDGGGEEVVSSPEQAMAEAGQQ
jgi:hypothetical protein